MADDGFLLIPFISGELIIRLDYHSSFIWSYLHAKQ